MGSPVCGSSSMKWARAQKKPASEQHIHDHVLLELPLHPLNGHIREFHRHRSREHALTHTPQCLM